MTGTASLAAESANEREHVRFHHGF